MDTDHINLSVNIPTENDNAKSIEFLKSDCCLSNYPTPNQKIFSHFFSSIENEIKKLPTQTAANIISNLSIFKELCFKNFSKKYFKDVLAKSFIEFYNIKKEYIFLTDLISDEKFKEFFLKVYHESDFFIKVFNQTLDDYKQEFRFRYKNFPFPKLEKNELPFWKIQNGKRIKCYIHNTFPNDIDKNIIFPRAVTLTTFLRLYKLDFFIHGIGGANYEWVQDKIIQQFFKKETPLYSIISGKFLIDGFTDRNFPYFFFDAEEILKTVQTILTSIKSF